MRHSNICHEINIFIVSFLAYSFVNYVNVFLSLNIIDPVARHEPLPDVGFYYLPHISTTYPTVLLVSFCAYCLVRFLRPENFNSIIKLMWCINILFGLRAITFSVTLVPPTTIDCHMRNASMPIEWNIVKYLYLDGGNTCPDYMFSGHAMYLVLFYLYILKYSDWPLEKYVSSVYVPISLIAIISGHIHYTVDVIVAIVLSWFVFRMIHDDNNNKKLNILIS